MQTYWVRWKDQNGIHEAIMYKTKLDKLKKELIKSPCFWVLSFEQDYL